MDELTLEAELLELEPIRAFVPYGVLTMNLLLIQFVRRVSLLLPLPVFLSTIILEFLATVELIAACAELDVVYELHGPWAYGVSLFILCFLWGKCWCGAEACPCDPIEGLILDRDYSMVIVACRLFGQMLGARYAYSFTRLIWSYGAMPHHARYLKNGCDGSIQTTVLRAAGIEGLISFVSRLVALNSSIVNATAANVLNAGTTVFLVLSAASTTGGFFNPILAAGLKFNCSGLPSLAHIFVYWISSMVGGFVARYLYVSIREIREKKFV